MHIPRACCLLSCALDVDLFVLFLVFRLFSEFDLDVVCFILSFSCGYYAVSSVPVSAGTRLAYDMYRDTYVRSSAFFIFV